MVSSSQNPELARNEVRDFSGLAAHLATSHSLSVHLTGHDLAFKAPKLEKE